MAVVFCRLLVPHRRSANLFPTFFVQEHIMFDDTSQAVMINIQNVVIEHNDARLGCTHRTEIEQFFVGKGELVVLIGPTGCGKTTFLHTLACLKQSKSAQRFEIADKDIPDMWQDRRETDWFRSTVLGLARQQVELSAALTVRENIELPQSLAGRKDESHVDELLARLSQESSRDLVRLQHKVVHSMSLSAGQRQRIGLARSLAHRPWLILVDEPTGNLDPHTAMRVVEYLHELRERVGTTIVAVTHQPEYFARYATQFIEMICPKPGQGVISRNAPGTSSNASGSRVSALNGVQS